MLKAYKSIDGYNFFVNGWVSNIVVTQIEGRHHYHFTAIVKHSQTLSATPLKVWVGCKSNGEVVTAHCTCMAGIGEVCSHIAGVLFAAEANTQVKQQQSCTSLPCAWLPPSFRSVEYFLCLILTSEHQSKKERAVKLLALTQHQPQRKV